MDDKIIVTNRSALVRKYGSKGLATIRKALTALTAADKRCRRGCGGNRMVA